MPGWKMRSTHRIYGAVSIAVLLLSSFNISLADVVHLHNGKIVRGRLYGITGDLIEFKPRFTQLENVNRLTLMNRHDVVEMRNLQKFFGEIVYADEYHVELKTATGRNRLNRFFVKNIVIGTPEQPPVEIPSTVQLTSQPTSTPNATENIQAQLPVHMEQQNKPAVLFPPANIPTEDKDSIPTDDRVP